MDEPRALVDCCAARGIVHDRYRNSNMVEGFGQKISVLLGRPAAAFMLGGVMAQWTAVKVWTDTARLASFGMHPTSHPALHEEEVWSALLHNRGLSIGDRPRPMLASDLEASARPMARVTVELPTRVAGGQLPSCDEPKAVNDARDARRRTGELGLFGGVRETEVPGWSLADLNVGDRLLQVDDARDVSLFAQFADATDAG